MEAFIINCGNCDGKNAICVAVEIALVTMRGTIATGKNINGTLAITTILDTIQYCTLDEIAWAFHGPSVIWWTPGTAINGCIVVLIVERGGLIDVGYGPREDADACNFRSVCDAHPTDVILHGANLASATRPMVVIGELGRGKVFMVIVII